MSTADRATMPVRWVLHEAMHDARDWLALAKVQPLTAGMLAPLGLPDGAWNDYYSSRVEVRANAFSAWAYS